MSIDKNHHRIMIVEDDAHINQIINDGLHEAGFTCTQAYSGSEARMHLAHGSYDLIILDLMLPGLSGEDLMRTLREELHAAVPVIVLSAKDKLDHKLNMFAAGADDYMTKPFELEELIARIYVHLRRKGDASAANVYKHKNLVLDGSSYSVSVNSQTLNLTRQEYRIVELLIKHPNRVFTKQDLYQLAWEEEYLGEDKTITVHISNIRHKIKAHCDENYIDTIWGIGFRLGK